MSTKSDKARDLRRDPSRAERVCWEIMRAHRMEGLKFRRQHPIGPFFVDFACVSKRLVVEIDGDFHGDQTEADARRTAVIERAGWRVVRFTAREVLECPEGTWGEIHGLVAGPSVPPLPASPPNGGEEHDGKWG